MFLPILLALGMWYLPPGFNRTILWISVGLAGLLTLSFLLLRCEAIYQILCAHGRWRGLLLCAMSFGSSLLGWTALWLGGGAVFAYRLAKQRDGYSIQAAERRCGRGENALEERP